MNKEDFIKKVKKQRGWIDELDAYLLVSIFTDEFGIIYTELPIEMELLYMWEKLNEVKVIKNSNSKVCTVCKVEKTLDKFYKDGRFEDGKTTRCSECIRRYMSEWNNKKKTTLKTL